MAYDVAPSFILGRYSPAALTTTAVEAVMITASGFRIIDHSFFKDGDLTPLKDMLFQEDLTLSVIDRATGKQIATIKGCLPTGVSQDVSSKNLATGSNTYMGLLLNTEDFANDEAADATTLPA
jgi:hypothetical protein